MLRGGGGEVNRWRDGVGLAFHRECEVAKEIKREAGQKARRWVVERTHSGINRFRRILIRWEKKVENDFGMLNFVCAWITYRSAGLWDRFLTGLVRWLTDPGGVSKIGV